MIWQLASLFEQRRHSDAVNSPEARGFMRLARYLNYQLFLIRGVDGLRAGFEKVKDLTPLPTHSYNIREITTAGTTAIYCTEFGKDERPVLVWFHGGAYVIGSPDIYLGLVLPFAQILPANALLVKYRLMPEYPFDASGDDAANAYLWLVNEMGIRPDRIVLAGESAGANLVFRLLHRLRDQKLPLPACAAAFSPVMDFPTNDLSYWNNDGKDVGLATSVLQILLAATSKEDLKVRIALPSARHSQHLLCDRNILYWSPTGPVCRLYLYRLQATKDC